MLAVTSRAPGAAHYDPLTLVVKIALERLTKPNPGSVFFKEDAPRYSMSCETATISSVCCDPFLIQRGERFFMGALPAFKSVCSS
jgi:hypothetical protein